MKDMGAFAILLLIAIFAFATTFDILLPNEDEIWGKSLSHSYLLMFGDFNYDDYKTA
jgi:hypothetical protein